MLEGDAPRHEVTLGLVASQLSLARVWRLLVCHELLAFHAPAQGRLGAFRQSRRIFRAWKAYVLYHHRPRLPRRRYSVSWGRRRLHDMEAPILLV